MKGRKCPQFPRWRNQISDQVWDVIKGATERVAARRGVRSAIEFYLKYQAETVFDRYGSSVGEAWKMIAAKTVGRVAANPAHQCTEKEIWSMSTRRRQAIWARREVWFRLHVMPLSDADIATMWKCSSETVTKARAITIKLYPKAAASIEERAMRDHTAGVRAEKKRRDAERKANLAADRTTKRAA